MKRYRSRLAGLLLCSCLHLQAAQVTSPTINTVAIESAIAAKTEDNAHYQVIGSCVWLVCHVFCHLSVTPELDEYLPDLLVSVYNAPGQDPWWVARQTLDPAAQAAGNVTARHLTGFALGSGRESIDNSDRMQASHVISKYVDVVGNPDPLAYFPYLALRLDTTAMMPYYQSALDLPGRLGIAELLRPESFNPFGHYIGTGFSDKWGYEFPRSLTLNTASDFKASVMAAQHAADIVTNRNLLHVVQATEDSCGTNCAVANVIAETRDRHEIWQEVYPKNRHIRPGQSPGETPGHATGMTDDNKGHGNYVFALWRHYRGCVQHPGKLVFSSTAVPPTIRR